MIGLGFTLENYNTHGHALVTIVLAAFFNSINQCVRFRPVDYPIPITFSISLLDSHSFERL